MYIPKHFKLHELLPPEVYNNLEGNEGKGWRLLDDRLLKVLDEMKQVFPKGSITINNYYWGGDRKASGLRVPGSKYYSMTSQHSYGRAADCIFSDYNEAEVRQYFIDNPEQFPWIKGVEDFRGMSWVHIDVRNSPELQVFGG